MAVQWNLEVHEVKNEDVLSRVKAIGDAIYVERLNVRNRRELERLGFDGVSFPFEPESYVGSHLIKTVAMSVWLEEHDILALMSSIG